MAHLVVTCLDCPKKLIADVYLFIGHTISISGARGGSMLGFIAFIARRYCIVFLDTSWLAQLTA